jgi:hypothetical protein
MAHYVTDKNGHRRLVKTNELRDPSLGDDEAEKSIKTRKRELVWRKEIGTENWLPNQANSRR